MTSVNASAVRDRSYLYTTYDFENHGDGKHQLGKGKHGKVKLAYDPVHHCDVAIKSQSCWGSLASRDELLLRALQDKNLPHVLRLFDVAQTRWRRYLVMERADALAGPKRGFLDYASHCFSGPRYEIKVADLSVKRAAAITAEVVRGLMDLHAVGVYHRDVKLQNVGSEEHNKLLDYGKSVSNASSLLRPLYEWSDARGVCRMFHEMLRRVCPDEARKFRHWYRGVGHLRVDQLRYHPLLCEEFGVAPLPTNTPCLSYVWHRAVWPIIVSLNWLTSKVYQLTPQSLPGAPQPIEQLRDVLTPQPLAEAPPLERSTAPVLVPPEGLEPALLPRRSN